MAMPTLLDVLKLNNDSGVIGIVEEAAKDTPAIKLGMSDSIPGQSYTILVRTAVPSVGFRNAGEGVVAVKSTWENRLAQTMILDASVEVDLAVADSYHHGGRWAFVAKEQLGLLEGAFQSAESQFFYGRATAVATSTAASPTKGFFGLMDVYDSTNMLVTVTSGSGSDLGSVWFVHWGEKGVHWIVGQDGELGASEPYECRLTDTNGYPYDGIRAPLRAYLGLQVASPSRAICRIRTSEPDYKLTWDHMYSALSKFKAGWRPNAIYMTARQQYYLWLDSTATNETGRQAALPKMMEDIPIYITDGLVDTEAA